MCAVEGEYQRLAAIEPHDRMLREKTIDRSGESIALSHMCDRGRTSKINCDRLLSYNRKAFLMIRKDSYER